ncbi:PIN domain-containing protein [Candidatus Woesearchaeota archaeon]|nr:PIN domain-containing protein [Candidatus Woesearchaeota archaeon]
MTENIKPLFLIDSNVLVYAYDKTDEKKHETAFNLMKKCWGQKVQYAISVQNLAEFMVIITKKVPQPLPIETAQEIINDIIEHSGWKVLHYDEKILKDALMLYRITQKHFWDTMIAATMLESKVFHIYTENVKDFKEYKHITVVNPFD